jgi:hypothetical protein
MKAIHFFYIGAAIDILAVVIALFFVIGDMFKATSGTNNPSMFSALLLMGLLIGAAFLLKNAGHVGWANLLLWIPGVPLAGYGLMILLMIIGKPDFR